MCIFLSLSYYFRTPLMLAATSGHQQVVQLLMDHGAQVDCTDKNYRTALHRAVSDMEVNQLGLGYIMKGDKRSDSPKKNVWDVGGVIWNYIKRYSLEI